MTTRRQHTLGLTSHVRARGPDGRRANRASFPVPLPSWVRQSGLPSVTAPAARSLVHLPVFFLVHRPTAAALKAPTADGLPSQGGPAALAGPPRPIVQPVRRSPPPTKKNVRERQRERGGREKPFSGNGDASKRCGSKNRSTESWTWHSRRGSYDQRDYTTTIVRPVPSGRFRDHGADDLATLV